MYNLQVSLIKCSLMLGGSEFSIKYEVEEHTMGKKNTIGWKAEQRSVNKDLVHLNYPRPANNKALLPSFHPSFPPSFLPSSFFLSSFLPLFFSSFFPQKIYTEYSPYDK